MSGAEAAGLILAALSILLETYDGTANVVRLLVRYRKEYELVRVQIRQLDLQYKYTLEKMLRPVLSDAEWDRFKVNRWCGDLQCIESKLCDRWGAEDHRVYLESMQVLSSHMQELKSRLVAEDGQPVMVALEDPNRISRRWNFGFTERARTRLLKDIRGSLKRLQLLVETHDDLVVRRAEWVGGHHGRELTELQRLFWERAHCLHSAVVQTLRCVCSSTHFADLQPWSCSRQERPRVTLHNAQATQQPWGPHVPTFDWPKEPDILWSFGNPSIPPRRTLGQRVSSIFTANMPNPTSSMTASQQGAGPSGHQVANVGSPPVAVDNACAFFTPPSGNCSCRLAVDPRHKRLGEFIDADAYLDHNCTSGSEFMSLADLMAVNSPNPPELSERLQIADKITELHMPVHSNSYPKAEVVFVVVNGVPNLAEPSLRRSSPPSPQSSTSGCMPNSVLFGLLLVHLCFGIPPEQSPIGESWPSSLDPDNVKAAMWNIQVQNRLGPLYAGAVQWCLSEHVGSGTDLASEFYREVVEPVRKTYSFWNPPAC